MRPALRSSLIAVLCPLFICAWGPCATLQVGADPVVVDAERVTATAADVFDTFLQIEYTNRALLTKASPQIHVFAEKIRLNGQEWLKTARVLTGAYKNNRTAQNKASLTTAVAVLQTAVTQSQQYIAKAEATSSP